jgi:hypothetical protein
VSEKGKLTGHVPSSGARRSRQLRATTCAAGIVAAGVGLLYVLTGNARSIDIVLIVGGLLAILAGSVLMRRS